MINSNLQTCRKGGNTDWAIKHKIRFFYSHKRTKKSDLTTRNNINSVNCFDS